jgi:hypothetical protein
MQEQLHDDLDSFTEISQYSDIDIIKYGDPDAKINRPEMSDSGGNSDDNQVSTNVGGGGAGGGGSDNTEDDDDEDWALRDENDHDFSKIPFCASFGFKPRQNIQMPVCTHRFFIFLLTLMQLCSKK